MAPPASRPLTTCAAIELGATPVTTATSPAYGAGSALAGGAQLWLVPANLSSYRDVDALVDWVGHVQKKTNGATTTVLKPAYEPSLLLGARTVHDRVKRALHLAVRAVAAEHTAVRRARQHHMQAVLHIGVGADRGESGDRALHAPQHQARLRFEQRARWWSATA